MKMAFLIIGYFLFLRAQTVLAECPSADLTHDCFVDLADIAVFAGQWLNVGSLEDLVVIPTGTFQMGDSLGDGYGNERPVHTAVLDSFAMGKYEITNGQYCAFLNSALSSQLKVVNGIVYASSDTSNKIPLNNTTIADNYSQIAFVDNIFSVRSKDGRDMSNDPMVCVSWYGAVVYCNWRSQQEGKQACYNLSTWTCDFSKKGYRLPTEAEWEYAARGGISGKRFALGDTISHSQANYFSYWEFGKPYYSYDLSLTEGYNPAWNNGILPYTSQVGSFPANGYGLYDMVGNAYEWCYDWYGSYNSGTQTNPTGPTEGSNRIVRDGSVGEDAKNCRVSRRRNNWPRNRGYELGFRVVLGLK